MDNRNEREEEDARIVDVLGRTLYTISERTAKGIERDSWRLLAGVGLTGLVGATYVAYGSWSAFYHAMCDYDISSVGLQALAGG